MKAINLKTEYLTNPIGIDFDFPRLMWNCDSGIKQTAYRIKAYNFDRELLWDSKKVNSSDMAFIPFPLITRSRERVFWKVKLWDENGEEGEWSNEAFFETGLKRPEDFKAEWITGNYSVNKKMRYPVDYFKKEFSVEKKVKRARLYMTACGIYSCRINGVKVSMPFAPGITDYKKRIQYQTYDVTDLIDEKNEITAELADGWYRGSVGAWGLKNQYGTETKLFAQLEIVFENGSTQYVLSDESWAWSSDGSLLFADNKDGEFFDARKKPSYKYRAKLTECRVLPTASNSVSVAEKETFKGHMTATPSGKRIIDFSQNIAGYVSFKINAKAGERLVLRFGEMVGDDGELSLKNIQCTSKVKTTPLQRIDYICKEGVNEYKTEFAVFGFRYMEIISEIEVDESDFTAIAVYSDMEETGFFESSNSLLNKFVEATKWSAKSNSLDLPTDCPTRERHGWTGDAQIFFKTASYLFDYAAFSKKYLTDIFDWQKKNGKLPQIVPPGGVDFYMSAMNGSVGWADAGVLIPYRFWKQYGDIGVVKYYYERMKRYARFMQNRCGKLYPTAKYVSLSLKDRKYLNNFGQAYGEWAEPKDINPQSAMTCVITHPETATAYTSCVMECMSEMASALGRTADAREFKEFSEGNKRSYRALMKTKQYSLDTDRQAQLVRALYFDMLDKEQKEYAEKRLIKALGNYGWRLGTGFLSTPLILNVLLNINTDYAYRLLENEKMPGWLFMTKMGATTIWESWEGTEAQGGIGSLNHYSKGAVCEWLFEAMCGIEVNGKNRFIISPHPGGNFSFAKAVYKSVFGTVVSGWEKKDGKYQYKIAIPPNCTAVVVLPGKEAININSGEYEF